jgi:hypothetical protein
MKYTKSEILRSLAALVTPLVLTGCGDVSGAGDGTTLTVVLTDAPAVQFESAHVSIGTVSILPADDGDAIILTDAGGDFDLLELQHGVTVTLANVDIEPGFYHQLRMQVLTATVTLADGYEFTDGSVVMPLKVPSGAQSGIKIKLRPADGGEDGESGIEITGETTLVVDFDVSQNFKIQGNPNTPAGLKGVLFTPSLRAVVFEGAGTISGTVRDDQGNAIEGATVTATRQTATGTGDDETNAATALTAADGSYTILFLLPATYDVVAEFNDVMSASQEIGVGQDEDVADIDFVIPAS